MRNVEWSCYHSLADIMAIARRGDDVCGWQLSFADIILWASLFFHLSRAHDICSVFFITSITPHREQALHALMPNVDKMAARQVACQIVTSQEFLALDKSMALNLRIQLTLKNMLERVARCAAINLLNVAQQSVHISPPQLNQPSSSLSSSSPVAVAISIIWT